MPERPKWKKHHERLVALLGEPIGTASGKLRKALLFKYVRMAGHDVCYRCSQRIESVEDFSIEHTRSWILSDDPRGVFFDLDGVAFSHLRCNAKAGSHQRDHLRRHGGKGYDRGCRCEVCRRAKSVENAKRVRARSSKG